VAKFSGATGEELWRQEINGTGAENYPLDIAEAVAVNDSGDVIAAGLIENEGNSEEIRDFAVIKFRGTDGQELWRREMNIGYDRNEALAVALDRIGNVAAAGFLDPPKDGHDFAVVKLNGADGVSPIPPHPEPPFCPLLQNQDQQICIIELNKRGSRVAKMQGKEILSCIKDGAKGRLTEPNAPIEKCLTADRKGRVDKAKQQTIHREELKCATMPDYFATDALTQNEAMVDKELSLIHEIFGSDLDAAIMPLEGSTKDLSKCQMAVAKSVSKCQEAHLKEFNSCKRDGLEAEEGPPGTDLPFDDPSDLELCMGYDPLGKILKACESKLSKVVTKKCNGVDTAAAFPGCSTLDLSELAACLAERVNCQLCLALNAADALRRDCDEFDDAEVNESCP
jgi:hypothetical protein